MDPNLLLAVWGVTFLLIVVPGPDWAFTLAAGARDRVVLPAVTGLVIGYTLLSVLVAAGVGAFVARSPLVLTTLTAVGAGYLVHVGISVLRRPGGSSLSSPIPAVVGPPRSSSLLSGSSS